VILGRLVVVLQLAADDLSVEREGLQHDVEAAAVLVRKDEAEVEPKVILAFAPDDGEGAVRRHLGLISILRHWGVPFDTWRCPA